jgi:hypothetical protein
VALILTCVALWLESRLLASMMALAALLPELLWNVDYFGRLLTGRRLVGMADYMFDASKPRYLRGLSLFHVLLPLVLLWLLHRLGYDERALLAQAIAGWAILLASYLLTEPNKNVNWVYGPGNSPQRRVPRLLYLAGVMVFFPVVVYWPTHLALRALFARR